MFLESLIEKTILSSLNTLGTLVKNHLTIYVKGELSLLIPLVLMSVFIMLINS